MSTIGWALRLLIRAYQLTLASLVGPTCRYLPSCSEYTSEAIATHGPIAGTWLGVKRICRCHPWGGDGYDPVPPRTHHHHSPTHP